MDDLAAFSDPNFTATNWVNEALNKIPESEPLEAYLASLAMKLHIISQDYADQLETAMVDAVTTMPRVLSEVVRVEEILRSVDSEISDLASQLRTFDQRNVHGVLELSRLDTLKNNMERCKGTLEEHARWDQLVREAKAFLQGGGRLAESADRLATMRRSLSALASLPGHEERRATNVQLTDALLAAMRPRALQDIASAALNVAAVQEYAYVYAQLDRHTELEKEYAHHRPAALRAMWLDYSPMATSHASFLDFFRHFMSSLEAFLMEEKKNVNTVFGGSLGRDMPSFVPEILTRILIGTLDSTFKLNLHERLRETMNPQDTLAVYECVNAFAVRCIPAVLALKQDGMSSSSDYSSSNLQANSAYIISVLTAIYAPMADHLDVMCYSEGVLLRTALADAVATVQFGTNPEEAGSSGEKRDHDSIAFEDATGLGLSAADVDMQSDRFGMTNSHSPVYTCFSYAWQLVNATRSIQKPCFDALQRSSCLVGGLYVQQAISTTAAAVAVFTQQLAHKLDELRICCGLPGTLSTNSKSGGGVFGPSQSPIKGIIGNNGKAGELNPKSATDAWMQHLQSHGLHAVSRQLIPPALRALQAVGHLSEVIYRIEKQARECLDQTQKALCSSITTSSGDLDAVSELVTTLLPAITNSLSSDLGAAYARYCVRQRKHEALQKYINGVSSASTKPLLDSVSTVLRSIQDQAGALFFDICTAEPERTLQGFSRADAIWNDNSRYKENEDGQFLFIDESILPQSAITQCGEHLLSLVQELELFGASDALADLDALRGQAAAHVVRSAGWGTTMRAALAKSSGDTSNNVSLESIEHLCHRPSAAATIKVGEQDMFSGTLSDLRGIEMSDEVGGVQQTPAVLSDASVPVAAEVASMRFVNEWLQAVCDAVSGLVLIQIIGIPRLSNKGRAQLAADLDYLSNVISAMGLHAHPLLTHVRTLLTRNPITLFEEVSKQSTRSMAGAALQYFDSCIARACGPSQPSAAIDLGKRKVIMQ